MRPRTCIRSLTIVSLLSIGLALPAAAQQISEQEANQAATAVIEAFVKAMHTKDAAVVAALFTENAIRVTPEGPEVGRAEIQKVFAGTFKFYEPDFTKLDRVVLIGNDVVLSVFHWAGTWNDPKGPQKIKGYGVFTQRRQGDRWKINMETINLAE